MLFQRCALAPPPHRIHTPQTRADAAPISTRDLRDADLPQSRKSTALFWNTCEMPNGSHGLQPSRPQSLCNFIPRGMRILSPAGRFGRLRLPPGCRPDRPHITPIRRLMRKPRRRSSPLLSPQPSVSVFRLGRDARRWPRVAAESEIHAKVADRSASVLFARPTQRVSTRALRMTGLPPLISHL